MRFRREAGGTGPLLEWRVRMMGAGAIVALVGIWAQANWLVNIAIAFLLVGFLLRFVGKRSLEPDTEWDDDEEDEAWDETPDATGPEESHDGPRP